MGNTVFGAVLVSVMKIGEELTAIHQVQVSNGVGVVNNFANPLKMLFYLWCSVLCHVVSHAEWILHDYSG